MEKQIKYEKFILNIDLTLYCIYFIQLCVLVSPRSAKTTILIDLKSIFAYKIICFCNFNYMKS